MARHRLLIVEDDDAIQTQLRYALRDEFALSFATDRTQAMAALRETAPTVVVVDLGLPPRPDTAEEGLALLEEILQSAPATKVVVVTGNGDRANALRAVQLGAFDYYLKPIELAELTTILRRAAYLHGVETESAKRIREAESALRFDEILASTPRMRDIFATVTRVARTDATVLVQGESGTGKELLARAIHTKSARRDGAFVPLNCGAIPETLLESELFGHEKGAYTGAHTKRKGKIELAEGGTLFLDEIGELSLQLQVKLLRFLQEREIERLGGRERIKVEVRIIAASNKDLKAEIQTGRFREDLYYRLSVVTIKVPPLRERAEDIVLLANAFLRQGCAQHRRRVQFSREALEAIARYPWPGNIRELENAVQRAVIMARGRLIVPTDLAIDTVEVPPLPTLRAARSRSDRELLVDALVRSRGNISHAAKELGVSRPTFHGLLDKHQVNAREFR